MSTFLSRRWRLNRRHFLRGVGAAIALPFLDVMQPLAAADAADAAAKNAIAKPKRAVFFYIPNGVNVYTWHMAKAGRDYELSAPLQALSRHREVITPISGLHHPDALNQQHVCADSWLTGALLSNGDSAKYKNTVSCDQVMSEVTAPLTRFPSLELSIEGGVGQPRNTNTMAYSKDGIPLPAEENPRHVFDRLFGGEAGGIDAQRGRIDRRRSVIDAVLGNAKALHRDLGVNDRTKLDDYLQAVREVEVRTQRQEHWMTVPLPKTDVDPMHFNQQKKNAGHYYDAMLDLIVLALRTDMTRVVTYLNGTERIGLPIPEIGVSNGRHELSHHNGDAEVLNRLASCDTFLVGKFAYFLDQLKAVREGDETLLDRTMVLFGSGMSYGHSHGNANLPLILAGGRGLGLKHGQHLDYNARKRPDYLKNLVEICHGPLDGDARMSNLLLTMTQKMDVKIDRFADSIAPIPELIA